MICMDVVVDYVLGWLFELVVLEWLGGCVGVVVVVVCLKLYDSCMLLSLVCG